MLPNFIRPTGNRTYKIIDPLGIKLLTRLQLGFSHLSEYRCRHNFADSLNPLCSCSFEFESTLHFSLRWENHTTLRRALLSELKILMMQLCLWMKIAYFSLCLRKYEKLRKIQQCSVSKLFSVEPLSSYLKIQIKIFQFLVSTTHK